MKGFASAPTKIVVTYGGLNERRAVLFVAKDAGIFQKHGFDAQVVNVRSGAVGLSALAAGETVPRRFGDRRVYWHDGGWTRFGLRCGSD